MFTGIIEHLGKLGLSEPTAAGLRIVVDPCGWLHTPAPGESIAINGCCLTVAAIDPERGMVFDVVHQTLARTTLGGLRPGEPVHLEHAATPMTLLGGHLVQGHVDGVGRARRCDAGGSATASDLVEHRLRITPLSDLLPYLMPQGSVAVDGVSLTIAGIEEDSFEVALIPSTLERTALGRIGHDDETPVNIEADHLVKTVIRTVRHVVRGLV